MSEATSRLIDVATSTMESILRKPLSLIQATDIRPRRMPISVAGVSVAASVNVSRGTLANTPCNTKAADYEKTDMTRPLASAVARTVTQVERRCCRKLRRTMSQAPPIRPPLA